MNAVEFAPDFTKGLLPVIVQDAASLEILMLAWINAEAWERTLQTGLAHYWSRSRKKLWLKGETSGNTQTIQAIRLDCDSDAIIFIVNQNGGAACHTGHRSCFFRELKAGKTGICSPQVFDPQAVYGTVK